MIEGDAHQIIIGLTDMKFRAVITSPPYFRHRHYGADSHEIGREQTAEEDLHSLAQIFAACRDLLTEDGSLWIVIGDTRGMKSCGSLIVLQIDSFNRVMSSARTSSGTRRTTSAPVHETTFLRLMSMSCSFQRTGVRTQTLMQ